MTNGGGGGEGNNNNNGSKDGSPPPPPQYGASIDTTTDGNFPNIGATLGPYFCLGRLGKGTFCSIHKCVNLHYFHNRDGLRRKRRIEGPAVPPPSTLPSTSSTVDSERSTTAAAPAGEGQGGPSSSLLPATATRNPRRLAAAKVEIGEFKNSGVLGGEAAILHFLDSVLPPHTVPVYMGHYRCSGGSSSSSTRNVTSAIVMEYLSGQDMHVIRDWAARQQQQQQKSAAAANASGSKPRRLSVQDAVTLTAGVMLPLLQRMHDVGIVHRDVSGDQTRVCVLCVVCVRAMAVSVCGGECRCNDIS
jgi:hypothetical protein